MGVISKIALRNMKRRKTRYILTTATLIIGVALFGGIMIASDSFYEMMLKSMDQQMGTADILIRQDDGGNGWFDPDDIDDILKDTDNVELISYRISGIDVYVSGTTSGTQVENSTKANVNGLDIDNEDEYDLGGVPYILDVIDDLEDAKTVEDLLDYKSDETGKRNLVISESLKIKLGKDIEAGSTVQIFPYKGDDLGYSDIDTGTWLTYTVTAVIRDSGEAADFDPTEDEDDGGGRMSFGSGGYVVFTSLDNAHELVDGLEDHEDEVNLAVIGVDDIHNTELVIKELKKELKDLKDGDDWKTNDLKTDSLEDIDRSMTTMRAMFMMFGLVALILSIVLIANIFNIIREEQEYETGMFQAIGASKSETFRLFITQGVIMGLIGSLIGTILSYWISYWIFDTVVNTMEGIMESTSMGYTMTDFEIVLLPVTLIATFAIGFFSCLIASISPSYKASKKPLIECLNPIAEKSEREKKKYGKKIIFAGIGSMLIVWSAVALFGNGGMSRGMGGGDEDLAQSVIAMTAPTYMLLGIIILTALVVRPLSKGIIYFFGPYLKQTKLLTEKNILRHRKRTVLTYSMIALTVSFLIGMTVSMDSMKEGVNTTVDDFMGSDARVFAFGPRSLESELLDIKGVDDVMATRYMNGQVNIDGEWVGHTGLEEDYDTSITINIIDPDKVIDHMTETEIVSPTDASLEELMDEINDGNNIIVTEEFADEYDAKVGDKITVRFSLGTTYSTLQAYLAGDDSDVKEETIDVEMEIIGIVNKIQGFFTSGMGFGSSDVEYYTMFVSWDTYDAEVSPYELPGDGTDILFRQLTQTGNPSLDIMQSNWFNFTDIQTIMDSIANIQYYTTRMDYNTLTVNSNFNTPVVGIHTNSEGKLMSDSYFGSNTLIQKNNTYSGTSMEELLNNNENVCVVDETFVAAQKAAGDLSFGIDSNVSIFPIDMDPTPILLTSGSTNTSVVAEDGTLIGGNEDNLRLSDDVNLTYVSNNENLTLNINYTISPILLPKYPTPMTVQIESALNATVDNLALYALNIYTGQYDKLDNINETNNHTLTFKTTGSYASMTTGLMQLRIFGQNSTADANFSLSIDQLSINITQSVYNASDPSNWPTFKVIGIINTPKLYNTERYFWAVGGEAGPDVMGNVVYINYNKSRELVFPDYMGSNHTNDKVTSVLVHCNSVESIESTKGDLLDTLPGGKLAWSVVDLKTISFKMRTYALDWYFWFDSDYDEEEVLLDIQQYFEDEGYIVIFGFTRTFMITTFISMINMMSLITSGMLILAIIISLIGLALHSLLSTMSRRREIGMLRSIGLSKKGIVRTISGETLIISILGVLVGIFAGLIQGTLMVLATPEGGFLTYTLVYPWFTIGILILITVTAAILSSRFPARWAANLNIIDAVRTR